MFIITSIIIIYFIFFILSYRNMVIFINITWYSINIIFIINILKFIMKIFIFLTM